MTKRRGGVQHVYARPKLHFGSVWAAVSCLLVAALALAAGARAQTIDPAVAERLRPSPLPVFFGEGREFHQRLFSWPMGDLQLVFLDALISPDLTPIALMRRYVSGSDREGVFGRGWVSSVDVRLQETKDGLRILEADGRATAYRSEGDNRYIPEQADIPHTVTRATDRRFVREWSDGALEVFDSLGRFVSHSDGDGKFTFFYANDSASAPDRIFDYVARTLDLVYKNGRLTEVGDPLGRRLAYAYDADGRLSNVRDALGRETRFEYASGRLARVYLPRGQTLGFEYDEAGFLRAVSGPGAMRTEFIVQRDEDKRAREVVFKFANGTAEVIERDAIAVDPQAWGLEDEPLLPWQREPGLTLRRIDAAGVVSEALRTASHLIVKDPAAGPSILAGPSGNAIPSAAELPAMQLGLDFAWLSTLSPAVVQGGPDAVSDDAGRLLDILRKDGDREGFEWDKGDRLVGWRDPTGRAVQFAYDAHNNLTEMWGDGLPRFTFEYNDMDLVTRARREPGEQIAFEYDATGNLLSAADELGQRTSLAYDEANRPIVVDGPGPGAYAIEYDGNGRLARIAGPEGFERRFTYDESGRVRSVADASGETKFFLYDSAGRVMGVLHPDGRFDRYSHDSDGVRVDALLPHGAQVSERYDGAGRLVGAQVPGGLGFESAYGDQGEPLLFADSLGWSLRWQYDDQGRTVAEIDSHGPDLAFRYDPQGRVIAVQEPGVQTSYVYAEDGAQTVTTRHHQSEAVVELDASRRVVRERDEWGQAIAYAYGSNGVLERVTLPGGAQLLYGRDVEARVTSVTSAVGDETASVRYSYDGDGRLAEIVYEDGTSERFAYDAAGRNTEAIDRRGNRYRYVYDEQDRLVRIEGPFGHTVFEYDANGRISARQGPGAPALRYDYAQSSLALSAIGPDGRTFTTKFDAYGRATESVDPAGAKILRAYDAAGRLAHYVDPHGGATEWLYDDQGNVIEERRPSGAVTRIRYDGNQDPIEILTPDGQTIAWSYNAQGMPAAVTYDGVPQWSYGYDAFGRPQSIEGTIGTFSYRYDALDRPIAYRDAFGKEVAIAYDAAGRVRRIATPEGDSLGYAYDENGEVAAITAPGGAVRIAYTATGHPARVDYPNGVQALYEYGAQGQLASLRYVGAAGATIHEERLSYDEWGRIVTVEGSDGQRRYAYDASGRLTEVRYSDGRSEAFAYDVAGNLVRTDDVSDWAYGPDNRLVRWNGRALSYDKKGNLLSVEGGAHLSYNAEGEVARALSPDGKELVFAYDPEGRRVETRGPTGATRHLYAGPFLLADYDGAAERKSLYVPGPIPDHWLALLRDGEGYYPVWSYLGSLVALTDRTGNVVKHFAYDAYGNPTRVSGEFDIAPHFAGRRFDSATGLYDFGLRAYAPQLRRFVSPDPLGPDANGNRYTYALSDPVGLIDAGGAMSIEPFAQTPIAFTKGATEATLEVFTQSNPASYITDRRVRDALREIAVKRPWEQGGRQAWEALRGIESGWAKIAPRDIWQGREVLGANPVESRLAFLFEDAIGEGVETKAEFLQRMPGVAAHEVRHVEQFTNIPMGGGQRQYNLLHELDAHLHQAKIDPTLGWGSTHVTDAEILKGVVERYPNLRGATETYYGPGWRAGEIGRLPGGNPLRTGSFASQGFPVQDLAVNQRIAQVTTKAGETLRVTSKFQVNRLRALGGTPAGLGSRGAVTASRGSVRSALSSLASRSGVGVARAGGYVARGASTAASWGWRIGGGIVRGGLGLLEIVGPFALVWDMNRLAWEIGPGAVIKSIVGALESIIWEMEHADELFGELGMEMEEFRNQPPDRLYADPDSYYDWLGKPDLDSATHATLDDLERQAAEIRHQEAQIEAILDALRLSPQVSGQPAFDPQIMVNPTPQGRTAGRHLAQLRDTFGRTSRQAQELVRSKTGRPWSTTWDPDGRFLFRSPVPAR